MATATSKALKESKTTSPPGAAEKNGHLTKGDEYRRKISGELSEAYRVLGRAQMRLDRAKSEQKAAKGDVEAAQNEVNDLVSEIRDIELGQYQPDLFNKPETNEKPKADDGAAMPIATLAEYGLSVKQCEKLAESKLEIKTVGDLEKAIRENEWWYRDVSGMGEKTIDKVTEALVEFRLAYPVPVPGEETESSPEADAGSGAAEEPADVEGV